MDTSFFSELNWLAVGVASLAYFALGAVWYTKIGFGNKWIKAAGIDVSNPDAKKGAGGIMLFTVILEFVVCVAIAILAYRMSLIGGVMSGIKLGLLTGLMIAVPVIMIGYLYQSKAGSLGFIDGGYHLVGNIIAAIIICTWH
jgi:hypothetical protein